jgi:hypothetical protein
MTRSTVQARSGGNQQAGVLGGKIEFTTRDEKFKVDVRLPWRRNWS